jgi:predicted nucleic-acid-binding Zn-ribbon protein
MGLFGRKKPIFDSTAKPSGPRSYVIEGKAVVCSHCGNNQFEEGQSLLNTAGLTFFGLDWANRSAGILICNRCSHIEWFLRIPQTMT